MIKSALGKKSSCELFRIGDEHYHCISALQKSIRGSDDNAAIYWLARMLEGGEDPLYIARRLVVTASEDVGLSQLCFLIFLQDNAFILGDMHFSKNMWSATLYWILNDNA